MIFFNSFTCNENFRLVCSKRDGISSRLTMMTFLHIFVILFLFRCHLTCEMKSHHGLTSWNFSLGWKYPHYHPIFTKGFLLHVWLDSVCGSAVCVMIISLKIFLRNLICHFFLFSVVVRSFVFFSFSYFPCNSYSCTIFGSKMLFERLVTSFNLFLHNWGLLPRRHKKDIIAFGT